MDIEYIQWSRTHKRIRALSLTSKDGDNLCRPCQKEVEDVNHVVNECPAIPRGININTTKCEELMEISSRCIMFDDKVNDNQECDSDAINAE